jgi:hypothetical protein
MTRYGSKSYASALRSHCSPDNASRGSIPGRAAAWAWARSRRAMYRVTSALSCPFCAVCPTVATGAWPPLASAVCEGVRARLWANQRGIEGSPAARRETGPIVAEPSPVQTRVAHHESSPARSVNATQISSRCTISPTSSVLASLRCRRNAQAQARRRGMRGCAAAWKHSRGFFCDLFHLQAF